MRNEMEFTPKVTSPSIQPWLQNFAKKSVGTSDFYVRSLEKDRGHFDISRFGDTLLRKYAPAGNVPSRMMTKARVGQWVARQKYSAPSVTPVFNRSFFAGE